MSSEQEVADGLRADFPPNAVRPVDIHLDRKVALSITWADGHVTRIPLVLLRQKCPCATCRTPAPSAAAAETSVSASTGGTSASSLSLNILPANFDRKATATNLTPVGHYALQMHWADGHDTGIYEFRYLMAVESVPAG